MALDKTSYLHQTDWRPSLGNGIHFTMADLLTYKVKTDQAVSA
ncbi:MAG: hypothetical protein AAFN10_00585 [Bacteroidota bacterium]